MSYYTWHDYGYGICVSDIREKNVARLENLLAKAPKFSQEFHEWLAESIMEDRLPEWEDYMEFENDLGFTGLAAILQEVISEAESIELLACSDFDGHKYLIFTPAYPWIPLNDVEKNLTEEKIAEILKKYIKILTDEDIDVDYQSVGNGG